MSWKDSIWKVKETPSQLAIKLGKFERNCSPLGIDHHIIYKVTENFINTGKHDSDLYPDFSVNRISNDAIEIYDSRDNYYVIVATFSNYKWLFFLITAIDRKKMGNKSGKFRNYSKKSC